MFSFPPEFPFVRKKEIPAPEPAVEPPVRAEESPQEEPPVAQEELPAPAPPAPAAVPATFRSERRKLKRDALAAAALLRIDGFHGPPMKVDLLDISIAGARFRCPAPLEIGEKAQVRLEVGPLRWTTRLRVVHCTRLSSDSVSIGCAFLRTELLRPWPAAA